LGTEIQRLEGILEKPGAGGAERRDALRRLARLQEISGNMEGAAAFWIRAASEGEGRDDGALLRGAQALAAMGEWEKAGEAAKTLLLSAGNREILLEARLLGAQIEGFRSGNGSVLVSLLDNRDYESLKPAVYYTLWKIQGDEAWKNRLLAECPRSPEGRIAAGDTAAVSALPRAMWLLLPGRAGFSTVTPGPAAAAAVSAGAAVPGRPSPAETGSPAGAGAPAAAPAFSTPAADTAPAPVPAAPPARNAEKPAALLQTGLFGREANAGAMAERLRNAGFRPAVSRRTVNGTGYWAVTVEPEQDMRQTILRLRDAGFESFPVN
jgi:cell division septation protein DedD